MSRLTRIAGALAALVLTFSLVSPTLVSAHEAREVAGGKYQFNVGFRNEPAYQNQPNGVFLRVRVPGTPATPVLGLEKTLQVEVTHLPTGNSFTKPLRALSATTDPGGYTADLLPTQAGQYRFRFFGTIETTEINETFTSGTGFHNVESAESISLPAAGSNGGTNQATTIADDALHAAGQAEDAAQAAQRLAYGAIGVAIVLSAASMAIAFNMRKRA